MKVKCGFIILCVENITRILCINAQEQVKLSSIVFLNTVVELQIMIIILSSIVFLNTVVELQIMIIID